MRRAHLAGPGARCVAKNEQEKIGMSSTNTFATIRAARSLLERHPGAPTSAVHVALVMATFANGRTGTSIRPGEAAVASLTGLHPDTVKRAISWLVEHGELRRDKPGFRGSAACFTYVGGMQGPDAPAIDGMQGSHAGNAGVSGPSHQPNQPTPSGPEGPRGDGAPRMERCTGEGCGRMAELCEGLCRTCWDSWYRGERTWGDAA